MSVDQQKVIDELKKVINDLQCENNLLKIQLRILLNKEFK